MTSTWTDVDLTSTAAAAPAPCIQNTLGCTDADVSKLFATNYVQLCRAVSRTLSGDHAIAEQVVMDAFVIVYNKRAGVRSDTALSYLWKVTMNEARSVAKRNSREVQLVDLSTKRGFFPHELSRAESTTWERSVELAHVRAVVDKLPFDQRVVIVLHYYCDWPDAEIAATLGCPAVTVRSRLRRARKTIERSLAVAGDE